MTMKILHTYCLNYNLGDYALGYGVKKALRELLPVDLIAETNLQGQVFDRYYIDVINRNYDLLVIGGGGIIHGAHWPQGWFWLIEKELLSEIKIPYIVFAAGYNYFKDEKGIPERGVQHLRETERLAKLFSVRNDGSHDRLMAQTGIDAKVIADAGFWVGRKESFARPSQLPQDYLVVQLASDKPEHRFGDKENCRLFVRSIREAIRELSRQYHVVLAPHVFDDIALSQEVADGLSQVSIWDFSRMAFDRFQEMFGYYQHAKCVLAMRGHGQIIPLSFGVPCVSLENHHKHRELMEGLGLGTFNIDVSDPTLTGKALALVERCVAERDEIALQLKQHLEGLWETTSNIMKDALHDQLPVGSSLCLK